MARGFSFKEAAPSKPVTASTLNGLLMNPRHTRPLCFEVPNVTGHSVSNLCWMANLTFQACDYAKNALYTDIFKLYGKMYIRQAKSIAKPRFCKWQRVTLFL